MKEKKCRDFSAEEVVRATVLDGAIRASDLLTGVSASSTAAAARDGVERFAETAVESSNRRCHARGDDVGMEATQSDWILVRCECRFAKPAATIVACSTRAHRRLCATVLRVHMGCTRLAMFATNMAEPAQQATFSQSVRSRLPRLRPTQRHAAAPVLSIDFQLGVASQRRVQPTCNARQPSSG